MHSDAAVLPGKRHTNSALACQDFCMAGPSWAFVSDGCSSGGHTDIGARLWGLAAKQVLAQAEPAQILLSTDDLKSQLLASGAPLLRLVSWADGLATLVILQATQDRLAATFFGDGTFLTLDGDGRYTVYNVGYEPSAPPYLQYELSGEDLDRFQATHGAVVRTVVVSTYDKDGELLNLSTEVGTLSSAPYRVELDVAVNDLSMALVCTDGLATIGNSLGAAAGELLGVRSRAGQFLGRRLGALGKSWAKDGRYPSDDLAVAGFVLGGAV